jgi:hypothetical protein
MRTVYIGYKYLPNEVISKLHSHVVARPCGRLSVLECYDGIIVCPRNIFTFTARRKPAISTLNVEQITVHMRCVHYWSYLVCSDNSKGDKTNIYIYNTTVMTLSGNIVRR